MEKREKAVLKRERREQRKQAADAAPTTFSGPTQDPDFAEPESGADVSDSDEGEAN